MADDVQRHMQVMRNITFVLNGRQCDISVDENRKFLWVLRTELGLTGTKFACGHGICGACTVVVGGRPVRSCMATIGDVNGETVTTIEGLSDGERLHPLQAAFVEREAFQCGFCTPGMLMAAYALLGRAPQPRHGEIVDALDRNLCRCGAHARILAAVESVASRKERS